MQLHTTVRMQCDTPFVTRSEMLGWVFKHSATAITEQFFHDRKYL